MSSDVIIGGQVEPGFEAVRDAFTHNFTVGRELGAAFCLHVEGKKVVDLWGGSFDRSGTHPYGQDTLQLVFSSTKGATAACANLLAQRGQLDLNAPVATYWPEFAQAGKEDMPVLFLLTHQAGLPAIDRTLSAEEVQAWDPVVAALAEQTPFWEPGTAHGYHALTYGWLVGEVVRRVSGRSLGTYFAEEIAGPLGLEFWIGLPQDLEHRVSPISGGASPGGGEGTPADYASTLVARALNAGGAFGDPGWMNRPAWHAAEVPAANGITNATSLSRLYAGLIGSVDGGPAEPILTMDQINQARTVRTFGPDQVFLTLGFPMEQWIGQGFWVSSPYAPFGGEGSFGHTGAGGSYGFADPEHRLAAGYTMNKMSAGVTGDPRARRLIRACYESVGAEATYS
ncbi:MAG TPA: serine hydrolase domain-containing protein [Acidimicrobiales bacterium]|jgi:CubicO group peptidase (beta-lactamase class C family)|nr:serine hydrolase domain-containing protein [Acidimicrobiales bacterium]